jgi:hypothetical protein
MKIDESKSVHEFTLFIDGCDTITDEIENALYEAGCDDGTLAVRCGKFFIYFAREACTMQAAIESAIQQVRSTNIGSEVCVVEQAGEGQEG